MPVSQTHANAALASELLQFTSAVELLDTPQAVLNALHDVTMPACQAGVLGSLLLPLRWGDWTALELGKTVFLHKSAPKGWWEEQADLMRTSPGPGEMLARLALAPYTMSETMQKLEPLGVDRWPFELALNTAFEITCRVRSEVAGWWSTGRAAFCLGSHRSREHCCSWAPILQPFACKNSLLRSSNDWGRAPFLLLASSPSCGCWQRASAYETLPPRSD